MSEGTVITGRNNIFTVKLDGSEYECRLKGKRLDTGERDYNPLAPGDRVVVSDVDPAHRKATIVSRLPRERAFVRFNRKRSAPQTLAVGVDLVVCVTSFREPEFRPRFVDRCLALAENEGLPAALVINKSDLRRRGIPGVAENYSSIGYPVITVSAESGHGLAQLRKAVASRRCVTVGQSGVGKSTLVNALFGAEVQRVGSVSHRHHRGRHTTNAARLIADDTMEIVDTPGVRELDVRTIPSEYLAWCFREFRVYSPLCAHSDCLHLDETGCAVAAAVKQGALYAERYESYRKLLTELVELENAAV